MAATVRKMVIDLVIFDCDGVLVDSEILASTVEADEITRAGYAISVEEMITEFAGMPSVDMHRIIENRMGTGFRPDFLNRVEARIRELYLSDLIAIEGMRELIDTLQVACCVASSSRPNPLGLALSKTGLFECFYPHIFSTCLVTRGKPAPDIFLYASEQMNARADRCVVVEDSAAGISAAKAAGMTAFGFVGGSHCLQHDTQRLKSAGADHVFDRCEDLGKALKDLNLQR